MELILKEETISEIANMQFGAVADIFMMKQWDEILIACNVIQRYLYNSLAD